jgi:hypothetical protein
MTFPYTETYTEEARRKGLLADVRGSLGRETSWGTVLMVTRDVSTDTLDELLRVIPYKDLDEGDVALWLLLLLQGARLQARVR